MKLKSILSLLACFALSSCGTTSTTTTTTAPPAALPTTSTAAKVQSALLTIDNVLQQLNTGVQTAAPTIEAILTMTHNQGDATAVNKVAVDSAAATPAITALLNSVQTAIAASTTPAQQIAAVNAATSPQTAAAIVAPIAATGN
jgi:hypothetical protein